MKKIGSYIIVCIIIFISIQTYIYYNKRISAKNIVFYNLQMQPERINFSKKNNYILYFDPNCNFCSDYVKKIIVNDESSIIFVTPNKNLKLIKNFIKINNLNKKNVFIDLGSTFASDFGLGFIVKIPTVLLINNKNKIKIITED